MWMNFLHGAPVIRRARPAVQRFEPKRRMTAKRWCEPGRIVPARGRPARAASRPAASSTCRDPPARPASASSDGGAGRGAGRPPSRGRARKCRGRGRRSARPPRSPRSSAARSARRPSARRSAARAKPQSSLMLLLRIAPRLVGLRGALVDGPLRQREARRHVGEHHAHARADADRLAPSRAARACRPASTRLPTTRKRLVSVGLPFWVSRSTSRNR